MPTWGITFKELAAKQLRSYQGAIICPAFFDMIRAILAKNIPDFIKLSQGVLRLLNNDSYYDENPCENLIISILSFLNRQFYNSSLLLIKSNAPRSQEFYGGFISVKDKIYSSPSY